MKNFIDEEIKSKHINTVNVESAIKRNTCQKYLNVENKSNDCIEYEFFDLSQRDESPIK